jgi:hypothetical protein
MESTLKPKANLQNGGAAKAGADIAIPITISAKDKTGHQFKEDSQTLVISKLGVKLATTHQLPIGTEVTIQNHETGRTSRGHVVWTAERYTPNEPNEIGIYLPDGEFLWGMEVSAEETKVAETRNGLHRIEYSSGHLHLLDPDSPVDPFVADSLQSEATGVAPEPASDTTPRLAAPSGSSLSGRNSASRAEISMSSELSAAVDSALLQFSEETEQTLEERSRAFQQQLSSIAEHSLSQIRAQAEAVARQRESVLAPAEQLDERARMFGQRLDQLSEEALAGAQAGLQQTVKEIEDTALGRFERQVSALAGRLQDSNTQVQILVAKLESLQREKEHELEKAKGEILAVVRGAVDSALQEVAQKTEIEVDKLTAALSERARERAKGEAAEAINSVVNGEYRQRLLAAIEEFQPGLVLEEKLQASAASLIDATQERLRAMTQEHLTLLTQLMSQVQKHMVSETAVLFRHKVGEVLAAVQKGFEPAIAESEFQPGQQ